ncbi:MAG: zinc ribbon domain-containing protein [Methanobrevibacter sp.]|jgi:uncharacterized protein YxeA|nr:zinc ribbon domain-containing protein [Candidatus Methanoflexus mossambicus]
MDNTTKFCSNCGKSIDKNAEICPKCGVRVINSNNNHLNIFKDFLVNYNTKRIIVIILIIILLIFGGIFAFNKITNTTTIDPLLIGKSQLKVDSETLFNGSITIYTYSNLKSNSNGSYNWSQFFEPGFLWRDYVGSKIDIPIVNGKATYDLPSNTQFFIVYDYGHTNKIFNYNPNDTVTITVSFYSNGVLKAQSISELYSDQFDISFGGDIYNLNGELFNDNDLVDDTNKFK